MIYAGLISKCHWCGCASECSPCELMSGEKVPLCAFCENELNQQIEDSWLPEEDDDCTVSQPGQQAPNKPL